MTRAGAALTLLMACVTAATDVRAQQAARTEHEVKAAYLFTFGRFVEWPPARSEADFAICVLGADPFGPVLDATLAGTPCAAARSWRAACQPRGRRTCHVLFISASEERQLDAILAALGRAGVLTVSDMPAVRAAAAA